ncbi:MAG: hemerythrin domain-containing protein, partial [Acidimicrobiia bacterium]|nr:hemerythrin domain-containing protein [Acidimicrobiia bacterium]
MPADPTAPADTTMMRIVHDALRRDLERVRIVLDADPPPAARQRAAIARHLRWMLAFLDAHHRSEDEGLYPVVRQRAPEAV